MRIWRCKQNEKHKKKDLDLHQGTCKKCGSNLQILCTCTKCKSKDETGIFVSYATYLKHNKNDKEFSEKDLDSFFNISEGTPDILFTEKDFPLEVSNFADFKTSDKEYITKECGFICANCKKKDFNGRCLQILQKGNFTKENGVYICLLCCNDTKLRKKI